MALSGHTETICYLSAFGKEDLSERIPALQRHALEQLTNRLRREIAPASGPESQEMWAPRVHAPQRNFFEPSG
jgi:hypothetical protein